MCLKNKQFTCNTKHAGNKISVRMWTTCSRLCLHFILYRLYIYIYLYTTNLHGSKFVRKCHSLNVTLHWTDSGNSYSYLNCRTVFFHLTFCVIAKIIYTKTVQYTPNCEDGHGELLPFLTGLLSAKTNTKYFLQTNSWLRADSVLALCLCFKVFFFFFFFLNHSGKGMTYIWHSCDASSFWRLFVVFFPIESNFTTLTFSVHAELFWRFHNPPNSDVDYRIFLCVCGLLACEYTHGGTLVYTKL